MLKKECNSNKKNNRGRFYALQRIRFILDEGSFCEIGSRIRNRIPLIGNKEQTFISDGVITGYGKIEGKTVFIYAQDSTMQGGTLGINHGKKIANIIKKAIERKCPIIGINDSGGARLQEGVNSLAGCGKIFYYNVLASGYIPQISIIAGPCAGGSAYSPGLADFVFTIDKCSLMFITGKKVIREVTGEECTAEELGGASMHSIYSGVSHFRYSNEETCYKDVRKLVTMLPASAQDNSNVHRKYEYKEKATSNINNVVPKNRKKVYDIKKIIHELCDEDSFFEVHKEFSKNIVIGFAKICGILIGIIANQPNCLGGVLDCKSSQKGARFVRYCDAYDIPLLTLVDTPGFMPGLEQERGGIIRHGAKLLYAYSESTNIKITLVVRKAYGGAYIAMGSKHLGSDYVYAWPYAEIAVMGAEGAVPIIYSRELKTMAKEEEKEFIFSKVAEIQTKYLNPDYALAEGYVDELLEPSETRKRLYEDIIASSGREKIFKINKKHGCMPL